AWHRNGGARTASGLALLAQPRELPCQRPDAPGQQAAVGLELRLAGTAQADTALLPLEVGPAAHQARRQVLELRQLDLELALEAAGALREDVEDQAAAIEHAPPGQLLEIALLARRQGMVHQDQVGACGGGGRADLLGLAAADEVAWIRAFAPAGYRG